MLKFWVQGLYLSLVPMIAVTKFLTHQLQVTCYIEEVLCIKVKYTEDCLFTDSKLQFYRTVPSDVSYGSNTFGSASQHA
jgi:hypothetical protein